MALLVAAVVVIAAAAATFVLAGRPGSCVAVQAGTGQRIGESPVLSVCRVLACMVAVVLLSGGAASVTYGRQLEAVDALSRSAVSGWSLKVVSDATPSTYGYRSRAQVLWRRSDHALGDVWLSCKEPLERGETLRCVGRYRRLSNDDYGRSCWAQGVCGSILVVRVLERSEATGPFGVLLALRASSVGYLMRAEGDEGALLAGCVCGSRTMLAERGLDDLFARCGAAHLVSVSGAHLAVMAALLARVLLAMRMGPAARAAALALVTGAYVAFCGAPASAVRAWAMSTVAFGAQIVGRRSYGVSSVCLVALLMALHDPTVGASMGFQLSVASVLGLCLFSSYASYVASVILPSPQLPHFLSGRLRRGLSGFADGARDTLCATLVCQAVTLPITADAFGTVSFVAPVANLLVTPLFLPMMALGGTACLIAPLACLGNVPLLAASRVARLLIACLRVLSTLPHASVPLALIPLPLPALSLLLELLVLVLWPQVSRRSALRQLGAALMFVVLVVARWRFVAPARIVVLDIGQGDAILVQDGPHAILVDAGPDDSVVEALARCHVLHLDAIVITHLHDDHYGGVEYLAGSVPCSSVVVAHGVRDAMDDSINEACLAASGGAPPVELGYGDVLHVGSFDLRMIWPRECVDGDENCESIELAVSYESCGRSLSALLTGDAEQDETGACIGQGDVGDIDLLKVGHHGSEVSINVAEAGELRPEVSVASAGEGNSYGHPTPTCVDILRQAGSWVVCTKDVGDVDVRPGRDGPVVRTHPRLAQGQDAPDGL
ncbi:MAG: ComEC/Rec2 family competence protein [Atopobiaceae bacterium]|nr:ComEC/Rec2 family competence protein [Atopobiaceae bacterium]